MKKQIDITLTVTLILLSLTSLLTIFSVAPDRLPQQATFLLLGFVIYLYLGSQESTLFKNSSSLPFIFSVILLLATNIFGETVRGSTRWFRILGVQIQTSEIVKPLLIIGYAGFLSKYRPKNLKNLGLNILIALIPIFIIFLQPDLGTALVHGVAWLGMVFVVGVPIWAALSGAAILSTLIYFAPKILQEYQLQRLTSFTNPELDPLGAGYNVIQSMIAIGSGKIFGKGLGKGTQSQLRFLPERHTDFVFASFAEEFGLIGSIALLSLFIIMFYRLLTFITQHHELRAKLVLTGIFTYIFFQTFLNILMNLGLAPVTGVTLPLISSGGSSILSIYISLGIAASLAKDIKPKPVFEIT